jgi:signal peptidase I
MKNKETPPERLRRLVKAWAAPIGCGLFFLFLLNCVFILGYVPTASMEPTIPEGSYILGLRIHGELQRGDVVIFEHGGSLLVKRIAGVGGGAVQVIDGHEIIVPDGCFFMTGDNADASVDSRFWADPFIHAEDVVGIVLTS